MSRRFSQIVVRVYPNGFPRKGPDDMKFHSPDSVVFMMWLVKTLSNLQKTFLRNMRLPEHTPLINDEHIRAMLESHGRILADQVMDLYVQILDTRTVTPGAGTSNPEPEVQAPMTTDPIDVGPLHVHTGKSEFDGEDPCDYEGGSSGSSDDEFVGNNRSVLDATEEDQLTDIDGVDDDYNLDWGFCSLEEIYMDVKNYNIRRAIKYKVLESDSMKYHCVCKQRANGCPWRIRVTYKVNMGYLYVAYSL
ncbi:hypothetical protein PIB30_029120 [Stylosanthes scabra]|uniref:Transposase MuDR plant domain-containing protein n=1 Tax=Stylosanthes scabra TaxID=79078 RepID=A0ABU6VC16_9FABA|nr:hypothetical protein [Stylosanthes scabra]